MESNNKTHGRDYYPQDEYSVDDILEELALKKHGVIDNTKILNGTNKDNSYARAAQTGSKEIKNTQNVPEKPRKFSSASEFNFDINEIIEASMQKTEKHTNIVRKKEQVDENTPKATSSLPAGATEKYNDQYVHRAPVPRVNKVMSAEEVADLKQKEQVKKTGLNDAQEFFNSLKRASKTEEKQKSADVIYKKFEAPVPQPEKTEKNDEVSKTAHADSVFKSDIRNQENKAKSADEQTIFASTDIFLKSKKDITGQVMMPGFEKSEIIKESGEWEEKWSNDRKEKVGTFTLENDVDEEEISGKVSRSQSYENMVIDDCEKPEDIPVVRMDLIVRRRHIMRRITITSVLFFLMLLVSFADILKIDVISANVSPDVYLITSLILISLAAVFNAGAVFGGFASLLKFAPDLDTPVAIGVMAAELQSIVMLFYNQNAQNVSLFGTAAVFALIIGNIGKLLMVSRIANNFEIMADTDEKYCCNMLESGEEVFEIGRGLTVGEAAVCFEKRSVLPKNFLANSFAQDPVDLLAQRISPYIMIIGLIAAALCFFFGKGESAGKTEYAISAFCAAILLSSPFMSLVSVNLPLKLACKKLCKQGAMLSGYAAVEQFGDVSVLALDAGQLFPEGTVQLNNIKNCGNISIDRVLLDAAGVAITTGGPLSPVFKSILGGKTELIPDVDTLIYEEKMGISGWVTGRRVLIGNRALMDNHGIWIPNSDVFAKYEREGFKTVYLSNTGVLSAVFLLTYTADAEITEALQDAVKKGISISVYSCDPNVNENMICDMFDLPKNSVRVMNAPARRAYKQMVNEKGEEDSALVHCFDAGSLARGVAACARLKRKVSGVGVLQILLMIFGLFLSIGMVLTMGVSGFSIGLMLAYQLLWLVLTLIVQAVL